MSNSFSEISNPISRASVRESDSFYEAFQYDAERRGGQKEPEAISNEKIQPGDVFLETYEVTSEAVHGGMGSVWKVHHRNWNADLAMKRPRPAFFAEAGPERKKDFIEECDHWMKLGLHPNISTCYYVREIGGVPTVFSEWMERGSLKDCIRDGSLYDGTPEEQQERILDIAVQAARGLIYAHEEKLIHQDMKPGNLLISTDWEAKVSDFGLVRACYSWEEGKEIRAGSLGGTEAYCPKEQADGAAAEEWMDCYSWALTVMEMYAGKRIWEKGTDAFEIIFRELDKAEPDFRVLPPAGWTDALREDLGTGTGRPRSLGELENLLTAAYRELTGGPYPRREAKKQGHDAGTVNNIALSYLDLGMEEAASELLEGALFLDPTHPDALYNFSLLRWREGRMTDDQAAGEICRLRDLKGTEDAELFCAWIEMERNLPENALVHLEKAGETPRAKKARAEAEALLQASGAEDMPDVFQGVHRENILQNRRRDAFWIPDSKTGTCLVDMKGIIRASLPGVKKIDAASEDDRLAAAMEATGKYMPGYGSDPEYAVNIYDTETGEKVCSVDTGFCEPGCTVYFPDEGRLLAVRGAATYATWYDEYRDEYSYERTTDEEIRVYDLSAGKKLYSIGKEEGPGCFAARHGCLAAAFEKRNAERKTDRRIRMYDADTGAETADITVGSHIDCLQIADDGRTLLALCRDGMLRAYQVPDGKPVREKQVHARDYETDRMIAAGGKAITRDRNEATRFWNETGRCVQTGKRKADWLAGSGDRFCWYEDHKIRTMPFPENTWKAPYSLCRVRSVKELIDTEEQFRQKLQEAEEAYERGEYAFAYALCSQARELPGFGNSPEALELSRSAGRRGRRTTLREIHPKSHFHPGTNFEERSLAYELNDRHLLHVRGGTIRVVDNGTGTVYRHEDPFGKTIRNAVFLSGTPYIFCHTDGHPYVIDSERWLILRKMSRNLAAPGAEDWHGACDISRTRRFLAVLTLKESGLFRNKRKAWTVVLWDLEKNHELFSWTPETTVTDIAFSPADDRLYAAGPDSVYVLSWQNGKGTGKKIFSSSGFGRGEPVSVLVSPDARFLLVSGTSGRHMLCCPDIGWAKPLQADAAILSTVFVPRTDKIFCTCRDATVRLLEYRADREEACREVFRFSVPGLSGNPAPLAVSNAGDALAVSTAQNGVDVYELEWNYEFGTGGPA